MLLCWIILRAVKEVEYFIPSMGYLKFTGDQLNSGHDFICSSNSKTRNFDYLLFFDSRGVNSDYDSSFAKMLIERVSSLGKTYLIVCRPLNLTTWATLIGFLSLNDLVPRKIITNMGFVDFTPKKSTILFEAIQQVDSAVGPNVAKMKLIEVYPDLDNTMMDLYSMEYSEQYLDAINEISRKYELIILNTPPTRSDISIQRKRPKSFFSSQIVSNSFNSLVKDATVVDFELFNESHTYDAVHFTPLGNKLIFDGVVGYI